MEFEEVRYGMLMMVLCDREGRVYDVWITFCLFFILPMAQAFLYKDMAIV